MNDNIKHGCQFEPQTPELRKAILLDVVDTVIISTINPKGSVVDIRYNNFQIVGDVIMTEYERTEIFDNVKNLRAEKNSSLGDIFRHYDGRIYFSGRLNSGMSVITAYHSKFLNKKFEGKFTYRRSLDRKYEDTLKNVNSVEFCISRYGEYEYTLKFDQPKTEKEAIRAVENFLSYPLTKRYYDYISDDQLSVLPWNEAKATYKCRGDCIRGAIFIESTKLVNGHLSFGVGS